MDKTVIDLLDLWSLQTNVIKNDIENSKEFQDKLTKKIEMYDQSSDEQKEQIFKKAVNKKFLYKNISKIFKSRRDNNNNNNNNN